MKCVILKESEKPGLPQKPVDKAGRPVWWVNVLSEDTVFNVNGEQHTVGIDGIKRQIKAYHHMTNRGYVPPVGGGHKIPFSQFSSVGDLIKKSEDLPDGWRQGDMLSMEAWQDEAGKLHAIGAIALALPGEVAKQAVELGAIKYFSPELGPLQVDDGTVLPLVLKKLDIVERPHQKGADTHILASEMEVDMSGDAVVHENAKPEDDQSEGIDELKKLIEKNSELIGQLLNANADEEVTEEVDEATAALSEANERIERLEMQRDKAVFAYLVPDGATIELNESVKEVLFQAYRKDAGLWQDTIGKAIAMPAEANLSETQRKWIGPIGAASAPSAPAEATDDDIRAASIKEAKGDHVLAAEIYRRNKYGRG